MRRPPEITSSIANSSATRMGGLYRAIELPMTAIAAEEVRRARPAAMVFGGGVRAEAVRRGGGVADAGDRRRGGPPGQAGGDDVRGRHEAVAVLVVLVDADAVEAE